tara:strand:- start:7016 stop:7489 length:474 start_codon:yes stop_codon:yes gene_type:complete
MKLKRAKLLALFTGGISSLLASGVMQAVPKSDLWARWPPDGQVAFIDGALNPVPGAGYTPIVQGFHQEALASSSLLASRGLNHPEPGACQRHPDNPLRAEAVLTDFDTLLKNHPSRPNPSPYNKKHLQAQDQREAPFIRPTPRAPPTFPKTFFTRSS